MVKNQSLKQYWFCLGGIGADLSLHDDEGIVVHCEQDSIDITLKGIMQNKTKHLQVQQTIGTQ